MPRSRAVLSTEQRWPGKNPASAKVWGTLMLLVGEVKRILAPDLHLVRGREVSHFGLNKNPSSYPLIALNLRY